MKKIKEYLKNTNSDFDYLLDSTRVTMFENKRVYITCHLGVIRLGNELIEIKTTLGVLRLKGENMVIKSYCDSDIVVTGKIDAVGYGL